MSSPSKEMISTPEGASPGVIAVVPLKHERIARLAYSYWEARGRPNGSPEEDWFRAEEELRRRKTAFSVTKELGRRAPGLRTNSRSTRPHRRAARVASEN